MKKIPSLSDDRKLNVIFRIEPGCLGPEGGKLIDDFCRSAQTQIEHASDHFTSWNKLVICQLAPGNNKALPEVQYKINNKALSSEKAEKYLSAFGMQLNDFEHDLNEKVVDLIDTHLASLSRQ
ncbi:hypothetical protein MNBD_GAMMA11-859 [hydrothermal vent metagenome]|uniref:Uncharacterized protein n=1 Tax=hydrothermal vent metagenome TaxID=652676 RepID=A0A3B0WQ37_9ZZZZ